jgi:hypothetical protein
MLIIEQQTEDFHNIDSFLVINDGKIRKTDFKGLKKIAKSDLCVSDACEKKVLVAFDKKITHFCSPRNKEDIASIIGTPSSLGGIRKRSELDNVSMMVCRTSSIEDLSTQQIITLLNHPFARGLLTFVKYSMRREYEERNKKLTPEIEDWVVRTTYLIIKRNFSPFFFYDDVTHVGLLAPETIKSKVAKEFWENLREFEKRLSLRVDDNFCHIQDIMTEPSYRNKGESIFILYRLLLFSSYIWQGSYTTRVGEFIEYDFVPEEYQKPFREVCKEYFENDGSRIDEKMINREIRKVTKDWRHPVQPCRETKGKADFQPSLNDYQPLLKEECENLMGDTDEPRCKYMLYQTISNTPLLPYSYDTIDELLYDAVRVHIPIVGTQWVASKDKWVALCSSKRIGK